MTTVNNKELSRRIKGYLSNHKFERPFLIAGKEGTGRYSIFEDTLSSIGIESVPFSVVMKLQCGGEYMVPFVRCENDIQFYFDYRLACDYVTRTRRPVVIIANEWDIALKDPQYRQDSVRYELSLKDWINWGNGSYTTECRLNNKVINFLQKFPEYFMTKKGCLASQWKIISDRWSLIDGLIDSWMSPLDFKNRHRLYLVAIQEYCGVNNKELFTAVDKYLNNLPACRK